ncbi:MAG TPA: MFS transporter [Dongiaceae bacterium]|nr:MFS transporter [Dongiaceae bacterium]
MAPPSISSLAVPAGRIAAKSSQPIFGILAVLVGAFIATLSTRITALGLADLRGAVHASFDEGAWIPTAHTVGQMLVCAPTVWAGLVYGPRRVLLISSLTAAAASLLIPYSETLIAVIGLQFIAGLAMGTFIPLTVSFVARNLPPRYLVFGIAAYAMNSEMSQNIAASLEGFYLDHASWKWIFWQNTILGVAMFALVHIGMPKRPIDPIPAAKVDKAGMLFYSLGLSAVYAALDQGNRLDWLGSGVVNGLLLGGFTLLAGFVICSLIAARPFLDLRYIFRSNISALAAMLTFLRFAILATSFLIPQYLTNVQGYRALQIGDVLLLIALPQLLLAPMIALLLQRIDSRITIALGFAAIGLACLWISSGLTPFWISDDFMPSQILQAVGQSFAMTSLVVYNLKFINPTEILAFGTILQTTRLMGGELGLAYVQTFVRVREQVHSNLVGLHVVEGAQISVAALSQNQHYFLAFGEGLAAERGTLLTAAMVQKQAYVLAYVDAFLLIGGGMIVCLLASAFLREPPKAA